MNTDDTKNKTMKKQHEHVLVQVANPRVGIGVTCLCVAHLPERAQRQHSQPVAPAEPTASLCGGL